MTFDGGYRSHGTVRRSQPYVAHYQAGKSLCLTGEPDDGVVTARWASHPPETSGQDSTVQVLAEIALDECRHRVLPSVTRALEHEPSLEVMLHHVVERRGLWSSPTIAPAPRHRAAVVGNTGRLLWVGAAITWQGVAIRTRTGWAASSADPQPGLTLERQLSISERVTATGRPRGPWVISPCSMQSLGSSPAMISHPMSDRLAVGWSCATLTKHDDARPAGNAGLGLVLPGHYALV